MKISDNKTAKENINYETKWGKVYCSPIKVKGYLPINEIASIPELSWFERYLYMYLCQKANGSSGKAWPKIATIQNDLGMNSKTNIFPALKKLEDIGLIKKEKHRYEGSKRDNNRYNMIWHKALGEYGEKVDRRKVTLIPIEQDEKKVEENVNLTDDELLKELDDL